MDVHKMSMHICKEVTESNTEVRTYQVEGSSGAIRGLEKLMSAMEMCNCGMSRQLKFSIDGDGSTRLLVKSPENVVGLSEAEAKALENDELSIGTA